LAAVRAEKFDGDGDGRRRRGTAELGFAASSTVREMHKQRGRITGSSDGAGRAWKHRR
jgi:hypothetical protein